MSPSLSRFQPAVHDPQVHYGRASLSALSRLPAYFVFGRSPADPAALAARIAEHAATLRGVAPALVVVLDQPLLWALPELRRQLARGAQEGASDQPAISFAEAAARHLAPGRDGADALASAASKSGRRVLAGYSWEAFAGVQARPIPDSTVFARRAHRALLCPCRVCKHVCIGLFWLCLE